MNRNQRIVSTAIDAMTELTESMDQHYGAASRRVPIDRWLDLTATARECMESLIEPEQAEERSAA
jgi:hypothetical protein